MNPGLPFEIATRAERERYPQQFVGIRSQALASHGISATVRDAFRKLPPAHVQTSCPFHDRSALKNRGRLKPRDSW